MALVGNNLAQAIHDEVGYPDPVSDNLKEWGKAIVNEIISNGVVSNASGTVIGTCPSTGGPLQDGAASSGVISNLDGIRLANDIASRISLYGGTVTQKLEDFCVEITQHIMNFGVISFSTGNITGNCTNTSLSSGPLEDGQGDNGELSGLSASTLASNEASALNQSSVSTNLSQFCTGLVNYLQNNTESEYASGNITGTCPAGGGPLQDGTGVSGILK